MVEFAGWDMPVQYRSGIVAEHLATRRRAGLFDVSHMGRFRFRGAGAEAALGRVLTNDPARLAPGRSQYTFIANERGGAEDDAYLYRLDRDDFVLVVNASNAAHDRAWLEGRLEGEVRLADETEPVAMVALQGPDSERMLETIAPPGSLPATRRNEHACSRFEDAGLVVARTGYTGEAVCFELFVEAGRADSLWSRLVASGAAPVGLGARDSLRLQAGLPLYGHELGDDPDGVEIPIFANALARFGVRSPGGGTDYVGRTALERQREEVDRLRGGEADSGGRPALGRRGGEFARLRRGEAGTGQFLPRVVAPIAVFGGRRPLRAGQKVLHDDRHVGFVTSGTSVPTGREDAAGRPEMRPIGLVLVDSSVPYGSGERVRLRVLDARGNENEAEIVPGNL